MEDGWYWAGSKIAPFKIMRGKHRYDKQRRLVTLETIQTQTIQNKKNLETLVDKVRAAGGSNWDGAW